MTIIKGTFTFQPGEVVLRNLFSDHGSPSMLGNQTLMGIIGLTSSPLAGRLDLDMHLNETIHLQSPTAVRFQAQTSLIMPLKQEVYS